MIYEISQQFYFDAAHTLEREIEADSSRRIHGHTYHAEVAVRGMPDPTTGMVIDIGRLAQAVAAVRAELDHRCLNEIDGIGVPTLENICAFIAGRLAAQRIDIARAKVWRSGGDACSLLLKS